jgi:hypothetical protein
MQSERDRRLIRIVEDALREHPEARESFLLRAAEGDQDLLAEASDLLAQTSHGSHFLTSWAAGKAARLVDRPPVPVLGPGDRLGPYWIERKLGAGGMGEVYEARDVRLQRRVAVKVLTGVSGDAEVRARILQEARALSRMNHPSICTVHDVGLHEGLPYLVMEVLDGVTLRDAIAKQSPVPFRTAMEWAIPIAEALHAAHQGGVIHRDLKPENIVITRSGVKLVDFGIAALGFQPGDSRPAGTLPYMSPEQIRGQPATPQSDLFAFGAILFEMVQGRPAFGGENPEAISKSILEGERPAVGHGNSAALPGGLKDLIETCLNRPADQRWQSAFDAAATLRSIQRGWSSPEAVTFARPWRNIALIAAVAAVLLIGPIALWLSYGWGSRTAQPVSFNLSPERGVDFVRPVEIALSPDGKAIAFTGYNGKTTNIYVRRFAGLHAEIIAGTDRGRRAFWSPDGGSLGFFSDGKLKRVPSGGGPAVIVCDAPLGASGTWGARGDILFSSVSGPLMRVDAAGGRPQPVTRLNPKEEETVHQWPVFLRDGTQFLYTATSNRHEGKLFAASTAGGDARYVLDTPSRSTVSQGRLYFLRGSSLISQNFNASLMRTEGDTTPVADSVGASAFSVSDTGVVAFWGGVKIDPAPLVWVDRSGNTLGTLGPPALYAGVVASPAGDTFAATVCESIDCADPIRSNTVRRYNLQILQLNGDAAQFTDDEAVAATPVWSPKGDELIYGSTRKGRMDLYRRKVSGGEDRLVLRAGRDSGSTSWSRDGRFLAYTELSPDTRFDIWIVDLATGTPQPFLKTRASETLAAFSPNRKWVAYSTDEGGTPSVYVLPFSPNPALWGKAKPIRVSPGEGVIGLWRSDGSELFVQAGMEVVAVSVAEQGGTARFGPPRRLFRLRRMAGMGNTFAPSPDGQRFLILDGPVQSDASVTVRIP